MTEMGEARVRAQKPTRVAVVTNIPAPYRLQVFEHLVAHQDLDVCVFYCSGREPDREWDLRHSPVKQQFFKEKFFTYRGKFVHCNPDAWGALAAFRPDVVITSGFNPTFLVAYLYARWHGAHHIAMTDGTATTEASLSAVHRFVRRRVYAGTSAFIGASLGSFELYRSYGIADAKMFQSHLCANNDDYVGVAEQVSKTHDFVFSGRFVPGKNPLFALEVAQAVARRLGRQMSILLLGSGEMADEMRKVADGMATEVSATFAGFVKQAQLPSLYASARILLFPTQLDTWGVVANEACAAGLPVVVTPMAGVAGELVVHEDNGYVLPLALKAWVDACVALLTRPTLYARFAQRSVERVKPYTYRNAAEGIYEAVLSTR